MSTESDRAGAYSLKYMDTHERAFILPFYGEFGWLVMNHVRYVHAHPAREKVVCCQRGMECLFPSATGFFHDYENPLPDDRRSGEGGQHGWGSDRCQRTDDVLRGLCAERFPGFEPVRPVYDCCWHVSDLVKPSVIREPALPVCDVVIAPRKRGLAPERNFAGWTAVAEALQQAGFTVGLAGTREQSLDVRYSKAAAWDHPRGATYGSVDLLATCRLYLGGDSGVMHLAALMDTPMVVWFVPTRNIDFSFIGVAERASRSYCRRLPDGAGDARAITEAALAYLNGIGRTRRVPRAYAEHGEDRWIADNLPLPAAGVFVEAGAGDAHSISNTRFFQHLGWRGLLVDPDPRRAYEPTPGVTHIACALADYEGQAEFALHPANPDLSGLRPGLPGTRVPVRVRRLQDVCHEHGISEIDLLSIDTEGTELAVWQGRGQLRPRIVIVEHNTVGMPSAAARVRRQFVSDGYVERHCTPSNLIFERKE